MALNVFAETLHILIAAHLIGHNNHTLKCSAQLSVNDVIHEFIVRLLKIQPFQSHIFLARLFVNTHCKKACGQLQDIL